MHEETKEHLGRYLTKVIISALIARIIKHDNYLLSFSLWVFLYAVFAAIYAVLERQRLSRDNLSYWDEAIWLGATALMLQFINQIA